MTDRRTDRHPHRFMIWPHVVGHIISLLRDMQASSLCNRHSHSTVHYQPYVSLRSTTYTHSIPTGIHHHVHIRHDRSKTAASPRMYSARGRLPWQGELMLHSICLLNSCLRDRGHECLPHDAMHKRSLCHQAVSVCLSGPKKTLKFQSTSKCIQNLLII